MGKISRLKAHITAEANRIIAALKPKEAKRYVPKGNGLRGPKTRAMQTQLRVFEAFLERYPVTDEFSRISRAHQCWVKHPEWTEKTRAKNEFRGYSSYKALAAAK